MNTVSNKVLVDPSLIVAESSIGKTIQKVTALSYTEPQFEFFYPKSLHALIKKPEWREKRLAPKYFLGNARPAPQAEILSFLEGAKPAVSAFQVKVEHRKKHHEYYQALQAEVELVSEATEEERETFDEIGITFRERRSYLDEDIMNILFEEWVFLNESSWIASRIRQPFTKFVHVGAPCIQFSKRATDLLIRKTLKKKDDELLSKLDRLRALGKWIAVGGPSIAAAMLAGPLIGLIAPIPAGFFLLFDP